MTSKSDLHLEWSDKQRRILTANGKASEYFTAERGFAYDEEDLPHHHLEQCQGIFPPSWMSEQFNDITVGAWERTLFYGGFEHTTSDYERVYNIQTKTLFVDLRIPKSRPSYLSEIDSLESCNGDQLRNYARQHIFAGFTRVKDPGEDNKMAALCSRHHCIDWNYVGVGRNRPNQWYVEMNAEQTVWKEWAFAKDFNGQYYYCEHWQRLDQGGSVDGPVVAFRKKTELDGILVVVGDHFNYCINRNIPEYHSPGKPASLIEAVDTAVLDDDLNAARRLLSVQGGHGRISQGWTLDASIEPWKEGRSLWEGDDFHISGTSLQDAVLHWNGEWVVVESSESLDDLKLLFSSKAGSQKI